MFFRKKARIVTHSGDFHCDDLFAVSTLALYLDSKKIAYSITRTRVQETITKSDYAVDVGTVYDSSKNRFDHHQDGIPARANGHPFASFGMVWKKFGKELCNGSDDVAIELDKKIVQPIDLTDNGIEVSVCSFGDVSQYTIEDFVSSFRPSWKECEGSDKAFNYLVGVVKNVIQREIIRTSDYYEANRLVKKIYDDAKDKAIMVLDKKYPMEIFQKLNDVIYVVYPSDGNWRVKVVNENNFSFKSRKNLPLSWCGKRTDELAKLSGVPDAIFCYKGFTAVAGSKNGALKLAQIALKTN